MIRNMTESITRIGQLSGAAGAGLITGVGLSAGWFGLGSLLDGFGGFALIGALALFLGLGASLIGAMIAFDALVAPDRTRAARRGTPRRAERSPTDGRIDRRGEEHHFRAVFGGSPRREPAADLTPQSVFGASMVLAGAAFFVWFVVERGIV